MWNLFFILSYLLDKRNANASPTFDHRFVGDCSSHPRRASNWHSLFRQSVIFYRQAIQRKHLLNGNYDMFHHLIEFYCLLALKCSQVPPSSWSNMIPFNHNFKSIRKLSEKFSGTLSWPLIKRDWVTILHNQFKVVMIESVLQQCKLCTLVAQWLWWFFVQKWLDGDYRCPRTS